MTTCVILWHYIILLYYRRRCSCSDSVSQSKLSGQTGTRPSKNHSPCQGRYLCLSQNSPHFLKAETKFQKTWDLGLDFHQGAWGAKGTERWWRRQLQGLGYIRKAKKTARGNSPSSPEPKPRLFMDWNRAHCSPALAASVREGCSHHTSLQDGGGEHLPDPTRKVCSPHWWQK